MKIKQCARFSNDSEGVKIYFVNGSRADLSMELDRRTPNQKFFELYAKLGTDQKLT